MDDIKALEESMRELIQQAGDMRQPAKNTDNAKLRDTLLKAADGFEEAAQNLLKGLRGMRENLQ